MELELGLKITRTREDVSSSVDFRFSKDPFGPLLLSRETDSRFIVIIHLKGFKKEGIEIEINKEGNRITIRGRKPVEEMVLVRWMAWRKEVELRAFRKVFRIPDIVDLDKIKARFDEDDMTLTITMPKRVKGISGFKIEEEEEEERVDFGDVSEIDAREELESIEREESDEHSEKSEESQREEFGEMMEKERESEVLEDEAKDLNGGLEEEEEVSATIGEEAIEEVKNGKTAETDAKTEDEEQGWSEPQMSEKQEKILEYVEEKEAVGQQKLEEQKMVSSNTESEVSGIRKLPDFDEQDSHEKTRHEAEQESKQELVEQQVSEAETKSDDIGTRSFEEIEQKEPDELERTSKSGEEKEKILAMEKSTNDEHDNSSKVQESMEGDTTCDQGKGEVKKKIGKTEIKNEDAIEEIDAKMGKGAKENIERTQVQGEEEFSAEIGEGFTGQEEIEEVKKGKTAETDAKTEDEEQGWFEPQMSDKQEKILEYVEEKEEAVGQQKLEEQEMVSSNTESADSGIRKLTDIDEHEQTRHEAEQEKKQELVEQQVSETATKSDDIGTRSFEEIDQKELDELERTSESGEEKEKVLAMEKSMNEEHDGSSNVQDSMEGDTTCDQGKGDVKKKIEKTEIKNEDAIEEIDAKMGKGAKENIERTQVQGEEDIAKSDGDVSKKWNVFDKLEANHLVDKREEEEEIGKDETKSEDNSLIKLQDSEEKQEGIKELLEEKTSEAETKIVNDTRKPVQETEEPEVDRSETHDGKDKIRKTLYEIEEDDGSRKAQGFEVQESGELERRHEEIKTQEMVEGETSHKGKGGENKKTEIENEISKKDVDLKTEEGVTENIERTQVQEEEVIAETETKTEVDTSEKWHEFDKLEASEIDKIHEQVEEEITKQEKEKKQEVGAKSGGNLLKLEEIEEQQPKGQKRHDQQEKVKQLIEHQTLEAEIENDTPKPVQEIATPEKDMVDRYEGKHKIQEHVQKEISNYQEENKEKIIETGKKTNDTGEKRVQELDGPRCEEDNTTQDLVKRQYDEKKEKQRIAETETKERESNKPQILREQNKIQDLVEEMKNSFKEDKNKKKEFTEKEDDISRNVQDTEQRDSDAVKGEKELVEEKICDEGKGETAVTETVADNDKSKEVQEIDKQESHEIDSCKKQVKSHKLIGGDVSEDGEVQDNGKKETKASGKSDIGDTFQAHSRDGQEKDTKDKAETRGLVANTRDMNNQLKQGDIEDREKTQELVKKKTKDCKDEEVRKDKGSEEPKTEPDDDVLRKVQGIKEHELYEPKRHPLSEMQELVEKKTGEKEKEKKLTKSEIEAEYGSLRKVPGIEEQALPERDKQKERDKFPMAEEEEPIGQEKENGKIIESKTITEDDDSLNVKETKEEQFEKPENYEKGYKIQELVEAEHDDLKEEQQEEKAIAKTELEFGDGIAKKVQEIGKQEYDESNKYVVREKMQEIWGKDKPGVKVGKEIIESGTKTKDGSLSKVKDDNLSKVKDDNLSKVKDGEDLGLCKPKGRGDEYKVHELVETGRSGHVEEIKRKDEDDILGSQEVSRPDVDEFEIQGAQSNNLQLVEEKMENNAKPKVDNEDDTSVKFQKLGEQESYEGCTQEEQGNIENVAKEEVIDLGVKHTGGEVGDGEEKYEKVTETKTRVEDDIYKKVLENEDLKLDTQRRYKQPEKLEELLQKGANDHKKGEENLMDDFTGEIQETESKRHRKPYIVQEIMEDKIEDKKDEGVEEDAAMVTKNEEAVNDNLKPAHDIKEPNVDIPERHESKYEIKELTQVETSGHQEEKKEKFIETGKKSSDIGAREVQKIRQQESDEPARCVETSKIQEMVKSKINYEEKEKERIAGTKAKEPEPFRPKVLREEDKIKELVEKEFAEKETKGEADMSRKDVERQDSGAIKGLKQEDQIQELVEDLSDEGKATIAVKGKIAENDKARNVQEMNKQEPREIDAFHKLVKFPELKGGEISGSGDNEEDENKKMTIEADKKIMYSAREFDEIITDKSNVSGKHEKGDKMKDLQEEKGEKYQDEHEKQMDEKETRGAVVDTGDDGPEKITGATVKELVNMDSQLKQDNIEEQEKTQELMEEKIKDCKEKEVRKDKGIGEPKTKTDDVLRKVQGIEEQEFYEQRRPLSEMQELVEEKSGEKEEKEKTESEIEAECGSLRKEHDNEDQEFDEPNIYKEQDKIRIAEAEEPIRQEKEEDEKEKTAESDDNNLTDVQEIKEERPPQPESHQKQYKIQEPAEVGDIGHKAKQQKEKGTPKKELEAEKVSAKNVQEIDKQEFDNMKRSMAIDKMQETGEEDKIRAMEEKDTLDIERKPKDGSLRKVRDGEEQELGKTKKHEEEDKIQELVEMERSGYKEEAKRKDKDGILIGQKGSSPDLNEFKNNIPQLVEEENMENIDEREEKMEVYNSGKFHEFEEQKSYEDWTDEEQEKITNLVREEATDPKDEHIGGREEKFVNDFTGNIQETGKEESHEKLEMVQEVLEEKSGDLKDEGTEEAVVGRSRKVQTIEELEEPEKQKEPIKVEARDRGEKVEEEEKVALKETGREAPSSRDQGKTVETMPHEKLKTKIEDRVEELKGKLVTENDSIRKGEKILENESTGSKIPKIQHQDVEERGSYQPKKLVEPEVEDERLEDYDNSRREKRGQKKAKTSRIPEDATKANDDSSTPNETKGQESSRLEGQKSKENHQELVERERRDQRKEENEEDVGKVETEAEHDSSRMVQDIKDQDPDVQKRVVEQSKNQELLRQKTNDGRTREDAKEDKETAEADGPRKGKEIDKEEGEFKTSITTKVFQKGEELESKEPQRLSEQDKIGKAMQQKIVNLLEDKEVAKTERKSKDSESNKKQEIREQEKSDPRMLKEQERAKEQERNQEDTKKDKETTETHDTKEVKEIGKRELPEEETHENRDNIKEFLEQKISNQEREDKKSITTESMTKEDPESKLHERLREKNKMKELTQHKIDNLEDEGTTKTETKRKDSESSKRQEIREQETCDLEMLKELERIKELVEGKTDHYKEKYDKETEFEPDSLQKVQEIDKEESIQELLDKETSEDDEEELEIEFEDEEEEWEAEVIQEMDSNEENDKIREIRNIKVGFRLIGGSALFMSLIVIVIRFIRPKKKIRPCKF